MNNLRDHITALRSVGRGSNRGTEIMQIIFLITEQRLIHSFLLVLKNNILVLNSYIQGILTKLAIKVLSRLLLTEFREYLGGEDLILSCQNMTQVKDIGWLADVLSLGHHVPLSNTRHQLLPGLVCSIEHPTTSLQHESLNINISINYKQ